MDVPYETSSEMITLATDAVTLRIVSLEPVITPEYLNIPLPQKPTEEPETRDGN